MHLPFIDGDALNAGSWTTQCCGGWRSASWLVCRRPRQEESCLCITYHQSFVQQTVMDLSWRQTSAMRHLQRLTFTTTTFNTTTITTTTNCSLLYWFMSCLNFMFTCLLTASTVLIYQCSVWCWQATAGYSGSDIRLVCKEAAMRPVRKIFDALENHAEGKFWHVYFISYNYFIIY